MADTPTRQDNNDPPTPLTPAVFHVLLSLSDGPLHGYAIMQAALAAGTRAGPGTIYGTLRRLLDQGLVEEAGSESSRGATGRRQRYAITSGGRRALRAEATRVLRLAHLVQQHDLVSDEPRS